ncbi:MAG: hypothetical protein ABSA49_12785 [Rhizomicrobium sp.]
MPALNLSVPPENASVPVPVTAPANADPVPDKVSVPPIAIAVPAVSDNAPEMETAPFTLAWAALWSDTREPKCAPASNVSAPKESSSVPAPAVEPAKVEAPVSVSVSPDAIVSVVPAPAENGPP